MYWAHRLGIGRRSKNFIPNFDIPAMVQLLEKNCLTVGWQNFSDNTNIVNAVESGDSDRVMNLMLDAGKNWSDPIDSDWARSLVNFTKMQIGDIIVVLPNKNYYPYIFVVKIKSDAKSILKSPSTMTATFNVNGADYNFSSNSGWTRNYKNQNAVFDVGFFHEVELLTKNLPRSLIGDMFNYVRATNSPVYDVSRQKFIDSFINKR